MQQSYRQFLLTASSDTRLHFIWKIFWIYQDSGVNAPPRQKCRDVGCPLQWGPHAMAQLAQWLIRHWWCHYNSRMADGRHLGFTRGPDCRKIINWS